MARVIKGKKTYIGNQSTATSLARRYGAKNVFSEGGKTYFRGVLDTPNQATSTPDPNQQPTDLLGVYKLAFGDSAGQAMFNSLQAPTPQTNDALAAGFHTQFDPYFQTLKDQYAADFNTQNTRNTEDTATATGNLNTQGAQSAADYATWQRNQGQQEQVNSQNAIGNYNSQYGDAFGSQMQQKQEALRAQQYQQGLDQGALGQQRTQEDLQRQRDALQQNFSRRQYDLSQLNTQNLNNLTNQQQTAQGDYANTYRYSDVIG